MSSAVLNERHLIDEKIEAPQDASLTSDEKSLEEQPVEMKSPHMDFPEGGFRAWSVVFGTSCVLFCTFGYANAFG